MAMKRMKDPLDNFELWGTYDEDAAITCPTCNETMLGVDTLGQAIAFARMHIRRHEEDDEDN